MAEVAAGHPARPAPARTAGRPAVPVAARLDRDAPEFRLFCLALRQPLGPAELTLLRREIAAGPDWHRVLAGARRHRVASPLLAGLQACRDANVPQEVVRELRRAALDAATTSLAQAREVIRLSQLFARASIPLLALKGVVLSAQLYGDPARRDPRDIDLLVAPENFAAAEQLLVGAGYCRAGPALSPRQAAAYCRWVKDAAYEHPESGIRIELHHRLSDNPALLRLDFAELWAARETVDIAGAAVATLPRRDLALYLATHGAAHAWEELRWLLDLAVAVRQLADVPAVLASAEAAGLAAPMLAALLLAHRWLGLALTDDLLSAAQGSRAVRRFNRFLAPSYSPVSWCRLPERRSFAGFLRYSLALRLYVYLLKSELRYWKHQLLREFITPADWPVLPLPDRLFWLFPLLRPLGWLIRQGWPRRRG